ncbi:MAG: ABC transporter ATP-binding protein [Eubacterium sp.]|nr:ABC transporter ATP-binding protein [Eubacterium sp.]
MEEYNICVNDLSKSFGGFTLDHISFRVPKGRIVGFIGENGAGKSTTIRLILNELKKDSGEIKIFGADYTDCSLKEEIGVVFDECNFHDVFTPQNIEKILSGVYHSWDSSLYHQYLHRFGLPMRQPVGSFSKGMKMKLSIISALAHKPKLLLLDEATSGLDPAVREEMLDLFLEFIQDEEHSIFLSSHIISDIQKVADYVILIHQGKVIFEELKDVLIYQYGILKCRKEAFAAVDPQDYLIHRQASVCEECLVRDREAAKRKYKDAVVDSASLEDIMLFYIKGGTSCAD